MDEALLPQTSTATADQLQDRHDLPDVRAGQLRLLDLFLVPRIVAQLDAEGVSERALGELDGGQVRTAATAGDRSVLGRMHDLALTCRLASEDGGGAGVNSSR